MTGAHVLCSMYGGKSTLIVHVIDDSQSSVVVSIFDMRNHQRVIRQWPGLQLCCLHLLKGVCHILL